jgi:copper chaperone CopZ
VEGEVGETMNEKLSLRVTGMTCGGCENAVKRTLMKLDGVESVSASHTENRVVASYDPARVAPVTMRKAIEALGYNVPSEA